MKILKKPIIVCLATATLALAGTAPAQAQVDPTVAPDALRNLVVDTGPGATAPLGIVDIRTEPGNSKRLMRARFVDVPLSRVADELGQATNSNVVVSRSVADQRVTVTLRDLDLEGALSAIAVGQGLVTRQEEDRGIYFLATAEDVRGDLAAFRATRTEVFTLLYPNARDVVRVIGDTFGDQVIVTEEDENNDLSFQELQNRFRRFDVLGGRGRAKPW